MRIKTSKMVTVICLALWCFSFKKKKKKKNTPNCVLVLFVKKKKTKKKQQQQKQNRPKIVLITSFRILLNYAVSTLPLSNYFYPSISTHKTPQHTFQTQAQKRKKKFLH